MQIFLAAGADRRVQAGVSAGAAAGLALGVGLVTGLLWGRAEAPAPATTMAMAPAAPPAAAPGLLQPAVDTSLQLESKASELDCLTQAVYFEARGETPKGQAAVAEVILNRVKHPAFPKTVCGVVYQGATAGRGCQFSFACDGAAERVREDRAWGRAKRIAAEVLAGAVLADVGGATHFHTTGVAPSWGDHMRLVTRVGMHVFYRFGAPRPAVRAVEPAIETREAQFVSAPVAPEITVVAAATPVAVVTTAPVPPATEAPAAATASVAAPANPAEAPRAS